MKNQINLTRSAKKFAAWKKKAGEEAKPKTHQHNPGKIWKGWSPSLSRKKLGMFRRHYGL